MKKSSDPSPRGAKTPVRQLALRREAAEQINYDAASSSSSSSLEDLSDTTSSFMTPSLEFPDRISFRNTGEIEGEVNQIPDDLSEVSPSGTVVENFELKSFKITLKQLYQSLSVATWMKKLGKKKDQVPDDDLSEAGPSGTSLRIGGGDGDMDRAYRYLGISGPHDLSISDDTWKAHMMRSSSDIIDRVKSFEFDAHHKVKDLDLSEAGPSGVVVHDDTELPRSIGNLTELTRSVSSEIESFSTPVGRDVVVDGGIVENKRCIEQTSTILGKSVQNDVVAVGGGIKGVRPPLLKPPPSMKRPTIDLQGSSWDFLTHFAPKRSESDKRPSSSSSSDNRYNEEKAGEEEEMGVSFLQLGDTSDEACSFTTNEGDSSSNTSPIYASGGSIITTSWQKGQLLRQGSFGSVYEAISGDGEFFAFKEVSLLDQGIHAQECIQQLEGEIELLSQLQHQNIVRYRGMAKDGSNLYIFLELTQGSLLKLYQRYKLSESLVSSYTKQILDGLKYLHDSGFIHRDIKCANILVDGNRTVKLADFGLAKVSRLHDIKSCKGTPFWMAPEVINRNGNDGYGIPADIWSLGCTVLEMLTSQIPYGNLEPFQAIYRIGRGKLPEVPETLSLDARHFILKCLKVNPEERPTAAELLNHPFVRKPLTSLGSGGSGSASPRLLR